MKISGDVRRYLKGVEYPADPQDLLVVAIRNDAPPLFVDLLGLLPTAIEFHSPDEVVEQLERLRGLV